MFCAGISSEEAVEIPLFWSFAYSAAVASWFPKLMFAGYRFLIDYHSMDLE